MCSDQSFDIEGNYKKSYGKIFSFFYLIEGIHQAIPAILPFYFLFVFGGYNISLVIVITAIALLPWSLKVIVGILNDKYGSEKYGQRFPFILAFGCVAGVTWILMTFFLPLDETIYTYLVFYLFIANLGMAFADTSLDGLILDVVPKDRLAKMQGYTWTSLMLGNGIAVGIGLILYYAGIIQFLFLFIGIPMIISCILVKNVKEPPFNKETYIYEDLKRIVKEKKNWKVCGWTFITAMIYPIIAGAFFYFMLVTMGIIDVSEAADLSLGKGQTDDEFLFINIIIAVCNGGGIVLGSILMGFMADKSRKSAINLTYAVYIPVCFLTNILIGFVFGLVAQILFGFIYGSITIVGQTIRGDIAKKNFPDLKSTYYALLIGFSNLGQSCGGLILAFMFSDVYPLLNNFFLLYFLVSLLSSGLILLSYISFKAIDPKEYEFERKIEEKGSKILVCPICGGHIDESTTFCVDCGKEKD